MKTKQNVRKKYTNHPPKDGGINNELTMRRVNFIGRGLCRSLTLVSMLAMIGTAMSASAQVGKPVFGIKGGFNVSTVSARVGETRVKNIESNPGFHLGITADIPATDQVYVFTGVEYVVKGFIIDQSTDTEVNAAYLQVPLTLGMKIGVETWAMLMNIGPYFAYGLGGKTTQGSISRDTFSDAMLKKFDCGVVCGVGFEFNKWVVGINSEIGFLNVLNKNSDDITMNNVNVALSVGYKF